MAAADIIRHADGAEQTLERLLGCRVEIVTVGLLAPDVAARIEADLVPLR